MLKVKVILPYSGHVCYIILENMDSQFKMKTQLDTTHQCSLLPDLCPRHIWHQKHTEGEFHPKSNSEIDLFWAQLGLNFVYSSV